MNRIVITVLAALFPLYDAFAESCFFRAEVLPISDTDKQEDAFVVSFPPRFYFKLKITEFVSGSPHFEKDEEIVFFAHSLIMTLGNAYKDLNTKNGGDHLFLFTQTKSDSETNRYELSRGEYFYEEYLKNKENKSVNTTRVSARRNSNTTDTLNLNPTFGL